jgi:hypothetical protein
MLSADGQDLARHYFRTGFLPLPFPAIYASYGLSFSPAAWAFFLAPDGFYAKPLTSVMTLFDLVHLDWLCDEDFNIGYLPFYLSFLQQMVNPILWALAHKTERSCRASSLET